MFSADWARVRLVLLRPPDYPHADALNETIDFFLYSLRALGCEADRTENEFLTTGYNILFCAHLLGHSTAVGLPANCIVYNTEQIKSGSSFDSSGYRGLLARYPVWDYSARNVGQLAPLLGHGRLHHVPVGYVPELTRIERRDPEDIDVLFYGSLNERRQRVIGGIKAGGASVHCAYGVYGAERDRLIARSRLVLNMHYFPTNIFEMIRVSYLLANRTAVVSERSPETEIVPELKDAVAFAPYESVVETCLSLLRDDARRQALADSAFERFSRLTYRDELAAAMRATGNVTGNGSG
jgi:hypothetical protein